jgi:uncharacterized protein
VKPRLVLFARYPTAGVAKTRLIPAIGPEGAASVHRCLTERTLVTLQASGLPVEVHYTGADKVAFRQWLGGDVTLVEQAQGDLTNRLIAAVNPAPVIFFGADTPDLDTAHINAAVSALEQNQVVVGTACDGGYYLIGMKHSYPTLLTDMPWSTDQVMPETLRRLASMDIKPILLEALHDCDRPEDLARWPWLAPLSFAVI